MTEQPDTALVPSHNLITFYDSVDVEKIPDTATYAALYCDGEFAVKPGVNIKRFTHRRWITVTGENQHAGIADYEYPNPTFTVPDRITQWANGRIAKYTVPGIVYSDMSDMHRLLQELGGTQVLHWIATRDRGPLSPEQLCDLLEVEFNVTLNPDLIWAHQYDDVKGEYDVSILFGQWYH